MEERKFELGQTVYSAQSYKMGRYVVVEYLTHETTDAIKVEVVVEDPTGRKEGYSLEDVNNNFFASFEEAKELALQNWSAHVKKMTETIENFQDSEFDELVKKLEAKKANEKK